MHYLKHPGPLFQVIRTVTKFFYLRDAEKNGIFHPGVPTVVSNHVMCASSLPSVFVHRFLEVKCETKAAFQEDFRVPTGALLQHTFVS